MAINLTVRFAVTEAGGGISKDLTVAVDAKHVLDDAGLPSGIETEYAMVLDVSQLRVLGILCTQSGTLKTNSSTTPAQTIVLTANEPIVWKKESGIPNPLTADVTSLFVTQSNADDAAARFQFIAGIDPTV